MQMTRQYDKNCEIANIRNAFATSKCDKDDWGAKSDGSITCPQENTARLGSSFKCKNLSNSRMTQNKENKRATRPLNNNQTPARANQTKKKYITGS